MPGPGPWGPKTCEPVLGRSGLEPTPTHIQEHGRPVYIEILREREREREKERKRERERQR